ncbi:MAG: D-lyxose/D-mannose family sugar isomerase [Ktedonobacteraceae bacterium]
MLTRDQHLIAQERARRFLARAGIVLTPQESQDIEIADFGLGELATTGLELVVYVNTERVCAKELVLFPRQTCPEHRHPPIGADPGKEETFRCRWGIVYLYVEGEPTFHPIAHPPVGYEHSYTVWHEIVLHPGEQHTIAPNTLHWFQSGDEGAVVSEFSTRSRDEYDIFTDAHIRRAPVIQGLASSEPPDA